MSADQLAGLIGPAAEAIDAEFTPAGTEKPKKEPV